MTLRKLLGRIQTLPPVRSGTVMVMVGINDVLRLTPVPAWRQNLQLLIEAIRRGGTGGIQTLIVGIPPLDAFRTLAPLPPPHRRPARTPAERNHKTFMPRPHPGHVHPILPIGRSSRTRLVRKLQNISDLVIRPRSPPRQGTTGDAHQPASGNTKSTRYNSGRSTVQPAGPDISTIPTLTYSTQQEKNDA